jgi:hypothetical protein
MSVVFFKAEDVKFEGQTKSYAVTADSGNINTRHFCPTCGSRVYSENSGRPGVVGIAIGLADQNDWFAPQAVVYTKWRPAWDTTSTSIPNFEAMPPVPPVQR